MKGGRAADKRIGTSIEDYIHGPRTRTSVLTVVGTVAFDTLARMSALPAPEETGGVIDLTPDAPGGTGGNVSMGLARLGAAPRLLACVGRDFSASTYHAMLVAAGVDTSALSTSERPTSRAYIFVDEKGHQVTYFYAGASTEWRADAASVADARVHFAAGEIAEYPPLMRAARWSSFDPGQEIFHRDFAHIDACIPLCDLLFSNRHELRILEERGWPIRRLLDEGPDAVVETRGAEGTLVHTAQGRYAAPAVGVRAVDPTGAGDAHRAGFLYALEKGADHGVAARFANAVGSFAVEHVGAQIGQPTLAQAVERYEKAYGARPF